MENLLRSTDVHTVFLDAELRVRKFTPRAELFNLAESDVGRRFDGFRRRIDVPDLAEDLSTVLDRGESLEKEAAGRGRSLTCCACCPAKTTPAAGPTCRARPGPAGRRGSAGAAGRC